MKIKTEKNVRSRNFSRMFSSSNNKASLGNFFFFSFHSSFPFEHLFCSFLLSIHSPLLLFLSDFFIISHDDNDDDKSLNVSHSLAQGVDENFTITQWWMWQINFSNSGDLLMAIFFLPLWARAIENYFFPLSHYFPLFFQR